jgi:biotin transport system ATP-binding protein
MTAGIELENVVVEFEGHKALSNVSVELSSKSTAIIGANGSGKSTFARLLNGLVKPTSGVVRVDGTNPNTTTVGFMFSNPDLQVVMPTVLEDVEFSLSNQKMTSEEKRQKAKAVLDFVGIGHLEQSNCHSLSSGQKQLLAVASTIVRLPKLLVADEPTTLLDLPNTKRITKLLHEVDVEQLVVVTHDLDLAATCDQVVWFHEGQLRKVGNPKQVIAGYRKHFE